ncbi:FAD-dependent oxidoreductase [Desulfuromonas acetoxidans]|uniref:FAD-dependent pyridine nucleotide-disulphide oxidoreductase n=1 Tax=Desulfuromonas acetoxidans (strain DSM 684 / 11070) TaxID=281689 RepID=Q1K431_DESA6|nr:FAD-dependent oxidoreductase [Desulfuromonas acetoxidans]EAT17272.1 FAD-dependent pyridine nucleotide-disulphide oxidoreductase [Desulfuromonas acetoxidans DSM 684]MBF0646146.1 FAD-dependent oxidoreductase [Desulfuromonas acetoxidans]NVD25957.1 FAD-dependent oxidoreductase [Desulfuromonas acetoxidans]NVE15089.1 FAD-dependent oxidoreductase [Desulfuromonas acetoxidans]
MDQRVVIIGGDAAGMSAASKIRREQPDRPIIVVERGAHTSYAACGMPYYIGGLIENSDQLIARTPQQFRDKYQIDVRTRHEAIRLDPAAKRVLIRDLNTNAESWLNYGELLLATGACPFCPEVDGLDARGIFGLSTLESGLRVHDALKREQPQKAVVVGGGYIGLEMAEALIRQGLDVALIQRGPQVMATLDPDMGELVSKALRHIGVQLHLNEEFSHFTVENNRVNAVVTNQRSLPADLVILGMGVRPNSQLAAEAGLRLSHKQAIWVDQTMRTSHDHIWAAGDCAVSTHLLTEKPVNIALGTIANKQGVVAGTNIAGGNARFPGIVGTAVSKICAVEVARTGLQETELHHLDIDYATATIKSRTRAGYYPQAGTIHVKMLGEKKTGKLLGAQIVGFEGAAKRIDILATALTAQMTVANIIDLDLSYAPPFSPVWDPVQTAARKLIKAL